MNTVFVAGGTGYIGSRFVDAALNSGLVLHVLTRSQAVAEDLNKKGVKTVVGDLSKPGPWQEVAANADAAIFMAAPAAWGKKVTQRVAEKFRDGLVEITNSFFQSLDPIRVHKVVYVAGTSYYGDTGTSIASEDRTPIPTGWGPYLAPAVEVAEAFGQTGFRTVMAFPGTVYGPESWLAQLVLEPLHARKSIYGLRGYDRIISPVHVEDCGRALLHLLLHGESGERYFIADDQTLTMSDLVHLSSQLTNIPPNQVNLPACLCSTVVGPVLTEYAMSHTVVSNQKLKGLGFEFKYPTVHEGLQPVIHEWRKKNNLA